MAFFAVNGDIESVIRAGQDGAAPMGDLMFQVAHFSPIDSFADFVMFGFLHRLNPFCCSGCCY